MKEKTCSFEEAWVPKRKLNGPLPFPRKRPRSYRRGSFVIIRRPWTDDELISLFRMAEDNMHSAKMAEVLCRTQKSVEVMMYRIYNYHLGRRSPYWGEKLAKDTENDAVRFDEIEWHIFEES